MAGKKRSINKVRSAKYSNYNYSESKQIRKEKQKAREEKLSELKAIRLQMIKDCCDKLGIGLIGLKKKFGTLNTRRLSSIMDGSYEYSDGYLLRMKAKKEKAIMKAIKHDVHSSKQKNRNTSSKESEENTISE